MTVRLCECLCVCIFVCSAHVAGTNATHTLRVLICCFNVIFVGKKRKMEV